MQPKQFAIQLLESMRDALDGRAQQGGAA